MISVIICTRNRPQDVAVCLPTVLACLRGDWEIVLVDQSGDAETRAVAERLSAACPSLHYVPTETVGKSRALDLGIARARGDILAFTDDDCEAPPDWLERISAAFGADAGADVLFGPVLPSPAISDVQAVCVPAWSFPEARDLHPGEVCGMGANMALRRTALDRLPQGGPLFDPALGPGAPFPAGEEGDFVYRLRRAGARAALRPDLRLYHRAWRTPDRWHAVLRSYGAGDAAFYAKHARCGDGWAARVLLARIARAGLRAAAKALLRRRPNNDLCYMQGLVAGLWRSLGTPVDRQTRFYRPAGGLERP